MTNATARASALWEPLEKTTVRLPLTLYSAVSGIAARAGRSLSAECNVALGVYVKRGKAQTQRARRHARRRGAEPARKTTIYLSTQHRRAIDPTRQHGVLRRELLAALEEHAVREQAREWRASRRLRTAASALIDTPADVAPQRMQLPFSSALDEDTSPTQSALPSAIGVKPSPARRYSYHRASTAPANSAPRAQQPHNIRIRSGVDAPSGFRRRSSVK